MARRNPVDNRTGIDIRLNGTGETCKFRTRAYEIYLSQQLIGIYYVVYMRSYKLGELRKYNDYLATLVSLKLTYAVVGLNHFRWLNKHRFARRRLVMYYALDAAFHGRRNWHHQSSVAQRRCSVLLHKSFALRCMQYIKQKYNKPGNVFLGVVHRLDRPVSGLVVFAKTSKALSRLNDMFRTGDVHKTYWAVVKRRDIAMEGTLTDWLTRNERQNKSYAHEREVPGAKKAVLKYKVRAVADNYMLIEVTLLTGRHHQIRCQLSHMGCPIKGDLKYGAPRSNPDGSISLLSRRVEFVHPVSKENIVAYADVPDDRLWHDLSANAMQ